MSLPHVALDGSGDVGVDAESEAAEIAVPEAGGEAQDARPDTATELPGDARQGQEGDALLSDSAALDGDTCAPACSQHAVCQRSTCYPAIALGYQAGDTGASALTAQAVTCIQLTVPMPACGYITGIGFATHVAVNAQFRFGLYDDGGGHPNRLLAQTDVRQVIGSNDEPELAPHVQVGCAPNALASYWACFVSSAPMLDLEANSKSTSLWATGLATTNQLHDYLQTGMPVTNPTSTSGTDVGALVHAWFAETPP